LSIVRQFVERFIIGAKDCKTIDCILIKLSSALYDIRSYASASLNNYSASLLVNEFLHDFETMRILSGLAHEKDYVVMKILHDPRFTILNQYSHLIIASIDEASKKVEPIKVFSSDTRAPTWQIEQQEIHSGILYNEGYKEHSKKRGFRPVSSLFNKVKKSISIKIIVVLIILIILTIAIIAMNMSRVSYR